GASQAECFELFSDLGFTSLVMEYAPTAETSKKDYQLVTDAAGLSTLSDSLEASHRFALRILGDGSAAVSAHIVGLAVATAPDSARYVPLRGPRLQRLQGMLDTPQLDVEEVLKALGPVLQDPTIVKTGHDIKFDLVALARRGVALGGIGL